MCFHNVCAATADESVVKKWCLFGCFPTSPAVCYRKQHYFSFWLVVDVAVSIGASEKCCKGKRSKRVSPGQILILIAWFSCHVTLRDSGIPRGPGLKWMLLRQFAKDLLCFHFPWVSLDTRPALATLKRLFNPEMRFSPRSSYLQFKIIKTPICVSGIYGVWKTRKSQGICKHIKRGLKRSWNFVESHFKKSWKLTLATTHEKNLFSSYAM